MQENIVKGMELIPKIWKLLRNWSTYYVLLVIGLGYWIFQDENRITDLTVKIDKNDSVYKTEINRLQLKIEDRNCVEEFKIWQQAINSRYDTDEKRAIEDLQLEKKRTQELDETYKLLKKSK